PGAEGGADRDRWMALRAEQLLPRGAPRSSSGDHGSVLPEIVRARGLRPLHAREARLRGVLGVAHAWASSGAVTARTRTATREKNRCTYRASSDRAAPLDARARVKKQRRRRSSRAPDPGPFVPARGFEALPCPREFPADGGGADPNGQGLPRRLLPAQRGG